MMAVRRAWLLAALALGALTGCSDEMPAMKLFSERTGGFDKQLHLDWTIIGGVDEQSERLLVAEDGHARRNRRGNLAARAPLTTDERAQLETMRHRLGRVDIEWHSAPGVSPKSAYKLRFDGQGQTVGDEAVAELRAFAEAVVSRLETAPLLCDAPVAVEAVVMARSRDETARLRVTRVLAANGAGEDALTHGDVVQVSVPEAREGVGGVPSLFALHGVERQDGVLTARESAWVKGSFDKAAKTCASR